LGLVPGQYSSGGKQRLGRINKAGDPNLRTLLIMGAKTVLNAAQNKTDPVSRWAIQIQQRRGYWKAVVAVAAKNARMGSECLDDIWNCGRHVLQAIAASQNDQNLIRAWPLSRGLTQCCSHSPFSVRAERVEALRHPSTSSGRTALCEQYWGLTPRMSCGEVVQHSDFILFVSICC